MNFVIHTQAIENYGAHAEDGKFANGNAYWKWKNGKTYIVDGVEREQDAVAFVMAAFSEDTLGWKEFPTEWQTEDEWLRDIKDGHSEDYRAFMLESAYRVSPATGNETTAYQTDVSTQVVIN